MTKSYRQAAWNSLVYGNNNIMRSPETDYTEHMSKGKSAEA